MMMLWFHIVVIIYVLTFRFFTKRIEELEKENAELKRRTCYKKSQVTQVLERRTK